MKTLIAALFMFSALSASAPVFAQSKTFAVNQPQLQVSESNDGMQLSWTTQRETNSRYFLIETSTDSIHFITLKSVPASGNSLFCKKYEDTENTSPAVKYIRITLVDMNGDRQSSSIAKALPFTPAMAHLH